MKQHHRFGALALVLVPLAGLLVGIGMSPAVHVGSITVEAPTASLGEEVKRQLEVPAGASMLFYPLNRVTEQVQRCYRVKEVSVERTSPHELLVKVTAWPAFAALGNEVDYTVISREGVCLYRQSAPKDLPVLLGLSPTPRPALGSSLPKEQMDWARDVLAGATKVALRDGLKVDFGAPHHIVVVCRGGLRGILGNVNNLERKMTIMGRLAEQLRGEGRVATRIDVSNPESPVWTAR